jgi:hypothetical protein
MKKEASGGIGAAILLAAALSGAPSNADAQEWRTGIGTGLFAINAKGDEGIGTALLGPVEFDLDLNTSDFAEVADSAFGLAGFSSNGTWTLYFSGGQLKLEDTADGTTPTGVPVGAVLDFKVINSELALEYKFANNGRSSWGVIGGVNYTRHKYDLTISGGANTFAREVDNDWADVIVGLTYSLGFSDRTSWTNRLDGGFGGSEGALHFRTSFNWRLGASNRWLLSLYGDYKAVDFENGSPGELDWYKYDVNEFGPGFGFAYVF